MTGRNKYMVTVKVPGGHHRFTLYAIDKNEAEEIVRDWNYAERDIITITEIYN